MLVIGLTGGIGSGKTTVAQRFSAHGVPVLDADRTAHELVRPGTPALAGIAEAFGPDVLDAEGALDRARLRRVVLQDAERRRCLEALLHPLVRTALEQRLEALDAPYCILSVPLLVESRMTDLVDRVLVVDLPEGLQYRRALARGGLSATEVESIMAAQAGRERRLAAAHDVIANDADHDKLYRQVDELHRKYSLLAEHHA
jgi:dephospho-CoA kinase